MRPARGLRADGPGLPAARRCRCPAWLAAAAAAAAPAAGRAGGAPRGRGAAAAAGRGANSLDTAWWSAFGDPQLDALIRVALEENKDLRIAAYRVEQFNAQLQVGKAGGRPQVDRRARSAPATRSARTASIPLVAGAYPVGNIYEIGGGVNWELDFWGRVRRANESALADLLATRGGPARAGADAWCPTSPRRT